MDGAGIDKKLYNKKMSKPFKKLVWETISFIVVGSTKFLERIKY